MFFRILCFCLLYSFLHTKGQVYAHIFNDDQLAEAIRLKLETARLYNQLQLGDEPVYCVNTLQEFYLSQQFQPVWISKSGDFTAAKEILGLVVAADGEGLRPADYHYAPLLKSLNHAIRYDSVRLSELVRLELLLSDAYILYASHLYYGKLNSETADPEWKAKHKVGNFDFGSHLLKARKENNLTGSLNYLKPRLSEYGVLRKFLSYYKDVAAKGGFPVVPVGEKLQKGDSGSRVVALKERLYFGNNVEIKDGIISPRFDSDLEAAVKVFQSRNGLASDGVVGARTVELMNTPVANRIQNIEVNMERLRWLPEDLGEHYLLVNLGNFELEIFKSEGKTFKSEVIIGKTYRKTPVFSSRMTYLVLNPSWTVPPTILKNDILPEARKDSSAITKRGLKVLGSDGTEVPIGSIDWQNLSVLNFPYTLRQPPGPDNALGDVKFMFPNPYSVYIHDTPSRELFSKTERAFSSGCIRLKDPLKLAAYLLQGTKYTRAEIDNIVKTRTEKAILLPEPVNVHILYLTAWADDHNHLRFGVDIYERDQLIANGLGKTAQLRSRF